MHINYCRKLPVTL